MSGTREYGWDERAEEGIAELHRMLNSAIFAPLDGQRHLLRRFLEIYSAEDEERLEASVLYPDIPPCKAQKRASKNIGALRKSIDEYYEGEGKDSGIRIGFASGSRKYRLTVRSYEPASASVTPSKALPCDRAESLLSDGSIVYSEKRVRTIPLPPVTWPILCFLWAGRPVPRAGGPLVRRQSNEPPKVAVWTIIAYLRFSLSLSIVRTSYRVHTLNFSALIGTLFVRREGKTNILSSYTATCPDCGGAVHLTFKRNSKGYRAECQNNPMQHVFSFDHTNLAGTHIVVR